MNKLKVFHIVSNPNIGGIEGMLSKLVPIVDERGHDWQVVNLRSESAAYKLWDANGVKYHRLATPGKMLVTSVWGLYKLLKREKPDVVEIYGLRANFIARIAAKLAGVPVIVTGVLNTDDWRKWYHVWLDRLTSGFVAGWVPNSRACAESLIRREHFPQEKIYTMYDGIDIEYWCPDECDEGRRQLRESLGLKPEHILFTTVGNLRHQKGYPYLIEVVKEIAAVNPEARFLFVGKGVMEEELKGRCRELGIDEYVIFAGYRDDIKAVYAASDVALLPSLYEGLPISLIEAMAMKLPVVSTKVSGIPELVVDGETGLLINPADSRQIVEAVREILRSAELRKAMGEAGRKRVVEKFSLPRMRDELIGFYESKLKQVRAK